MAALATEILDADEPASLCLYAEMLSFCFRASAADKSG